MSQAANYLVARGDCEKLTEIADPDVAGLGVYRELFGPEENAMC